jgi:hypothetical protein
MHSRVQTLAARRGISISCLLGEFLEEGVGTELGRPSDGPETHEARPERVAIRLRPGDIHGLARRATARRMKPSTYIAALVRSHLVEDPPLPSAELAVLERATAEVSTIGRNVNQIARAVNAGATLPPGAASVIGQAIEAVEAVREAAKAYVRKAVASWEAPLD